MCIKLVNDKEEKPYDMARPLEEQIQGCQLIVVNYAPFDKSVDCFLSEVERFAKTGIDAKLNIRVVHNDYIVGFKLKQKLNRASNDITLNEIIKLIVLSHVETDKKLEELANTFAGMTK